MTVLFCCCCGRRAAAGADAAQHDRVTVLFCCRCGRGAAAGADVAEQGAVTALFCLPTRPVLALSCVCGSSALRATRQRGPCDGDCVRLLNLNSRFCSFVSSRGRGICDDVDRAVLSFHVCSG